MTGGKPTPDIAWSDEGIWLPTWQCHDGLVDGIRLAWRFCTCVAQALDFTTLVKSEPHQRHVMPPSFAVLLET